VNISKRSEGKTFAVDMRIKAIERRAIVDCADGRLSFPEQLGWQQNAGFLSNDSLDINVF